MWKFGRVLPCFLACAAAPVALLVTTPTAMAQPGTGVDGRNVDWVRFNGGVYRQEGSGWVEQGDNGGATFTFRETGRDDWSVYLDDPGRRVQIQLDLFRHKVLYGENGGPKRDQFEILDARASRSDWRERREDRRWGRRDTRWVNAGPIWNQQDASVKCPVVAFAVEGSWTGQWRTTVQGRMSVCEIERR